jgi:hypothetical protein
MEIVLLCTIAGILIDPPPRDGWSQNQYKPPKPKRPPFGVEFARLRHEQCEQKREQREQSEAAWEATGLKLGRLVRGAKH